MSGEMQVWRLSEIVLRSRKPDALAAFYRSAFDFVGDAGSLLLGDTRLSIEHAADDTLPYPQVPGWSPLFQHFAIRVADMDAAIARLDAVDAWRPISTHGPERLPPNTGSVIAFKFRDPEGHPLEFLASPGEPSGPLFECIDHSAISVGDVARSIAFYEHLGLAVAGRSLNSGVEQSRLDGIDGATVDVVGLRTPSGRGPHLELLGYRGSYDRGHQSIDDRVATCLAFEAPATAPAVLPTGRRRHDPDGHLIEVRSTHGTDLA